MMPAVKPMRAGYLIGRAVTVDGKPVGKIHDILIRGPHGAEAIVSTGGALVATDNYAIVPVADFDISRSSSDISLVRSLDDYPQASSAEEMIGILSSNERTDG